MRHPSRSTSLSGPAVGPTASAREKLDRLDQWLDGLHADGRFNGTVLIAERGDIRFEKHCGFADIDKRIPLSGRSSFSLASVSKPFTGLAILMLAHRGALTLDDRLMQHIPELPDQGAMTIRHLLHHTSGIADHMELADEVWDASKVLAMPDLIALFQRYRPRRYFAPGDQFEYSNTGYAFLGEIVARASGLPYPAFMAKEIFEPLAMSDSAAFNLACETCPLRERVYGFARAQDRIVRRDLNFLDGVFGDGGIYASAEDLVRWDAALREGALLPVEVYEQATVSGRLNNGEAAGYGFGWEIEPARVVEHWGEWEGFSAFVRRDIERGGILIVLSNLGPPDRVGPICGALCDFVEQA